MNLRQYLFNERKSVVQFAKDIEYARSTISLVVNEKILPGKKLARVIERATGGKVKFKIEKKPSNERQTKRTREKKERM